MIIILSIAVTKFNINMSDSKMKIVLFYGVFKYYTNLIAGRKLIKMFCDKYLRVNIVIG